MLGLGRASQYAGWWRAAEPLEANMTLTFTVDVPQPALVSPRYYGDFEGASNAQNSLSTFVSSGSEDYDVSGIVNQPRATVSAMTLRVGTDFMVSAPTTGRYSGVSSFFLFNNDGTEAFFDVAIAKQDNQYVLGLTQAPPATFSAAEFDLLRNNWLGIVTATSNTSSTFASFAGGSDPGSGMATRTMVIDIASGDVLKQHDGWVYTGDFANAVANIDLTDTWTLGFESSTYYTNQFVFFDNAITTYDRDQCQIGSLWFAAGESFDPAEHYRQVVGFGLGPEANSVRSMTYFVFPGAGTAITGNTNTYGYRQDILAGSRAPANTVVQIQTAFDLANPPVFVEIN